MISFVLPALNEHEGIADTIKECFEAAAALELNDIEVVVVDDGSTDGTGDIARKAGATVVRHPAPGGYGRALKAGIEAAKHDTIVILDADGTYPLDRLADFHRLYSEGFDMIVGRRTGPQYRESAMKSPLRMILQFLVETTTGQRVPDVNSGLRMFSRGTIRPYFSRLSETFSFSTSSTLAYKMTGKFVTYVDIDYRERAGVTKVRLFRDSLRTLQFIIQAILYYNPLKIFLLVSLGCVGLSVVLFLLAWITQLLSLFLLGVGTLLVSLLVFSIGLLAVQLKEIMHQ